MGQGFSLYCRLITDAYLHQDYPFDELVEALKLPRDRSHNPLFDVMINMGIYEPLQFTLDDISVSTFMDESVTSKFDLQFMFRELDTGIQTSIEYNTDLFKLETAQRIVDEFQKLIDRILRKPEQSLMDLKQSIKGADAHQEQAEFMASTLELDEDF